MRSDYHYGVFDVFTSTTRKNEVNELTTLADQPVKISPLVWIVPVVAVAVFGVIYLLVLRNRK